MPFDWTASTPIAQTLALFMARLLPIVVMTPLFGGETAPRRFRFGVVIALSVLFLPVLREMWAGREALPMGAFAGLLIKETLLGLTLALLLLVVFETFAAFGALVDLARGASIATVMEPTSRRQQSVLGVFFFQVSLVLFLASGGYRAVMLVLAETLRALPPHEPAGPTLIGTGATEASIGLVANLISIAVRLAAPTLLVMLVVDVAFGLLNRVAPQIQVFFLSMTIKGTLGLLIVLAGLALSIDQVLADFFDQIARATARLTG